MPTFAQIRSKVSKKLIDPNNTAISVADVGDAINDAIRYWKHKPFWFNQATGSVALMAGGTGGLSLPSDFLYENSENGFVIYDNGVTTSLVKRTNYDFDVDAATGGQGTPYIYTYRHGGYELYYIPDQAYTLVVYYTRDYADLSADGDANDFTNYADQLVMYEALGRLSGEDRQDLDMNNTYMAKADREYRTLLARTTEQAATGSMSFDTL